MDRPIKDCVVCQSKTTDNFCSEACKNGQLALLDSEKAIKDHKYDKLDTRIFFFDHSLSELFDLYTIELLKCFHTKNIKKMNWHWNRSNLYRKTIITKINKDYVSPEVLAEYNKFIDKLYKINARMWEERNIFNREDFGGKSQIDSMNRYFDLDETRQDLKNEIDLYCGIEQYNEKNYNG